MLSVRTLSAAALTGGPEVPESCRGGINAFSRNSLNGIASAASRVQFEMPCRGEWCAGYLACGVASALSGAKSQRKNSLRTGDDLLRKMAGNDVILLWVFRCVVAALILGAVLILTIF